MDCKCSVTYIVRLNLNLWLNYYLIIVYDLTINDYYITGVLECQGQFVRLFID